VIYRYDAPANVKVGDQKSSDFGSSPQALPRWIRVVLGAIGATLWLGVGAMVYFVLVISGAIFTPGYGWVSILALVLWMLPLSLLTRWKLGSRRMAKSRK